MPRWDWLTRPYSQCGAWRPGGRRPLQTRTGTPRGARTAHWRSRRAPRHRRSRARTWWAPAGRRSAAPGRVAPVGPLPLHSSQTTSCTSLLRAFLLAASLPQERGRRLRASGWAIVPPPTPPQVGAPAHLPQGTPQTEPTALQLLGLPAPLGTPLLEDRVGAEPVLRSLGFLPRPRQDEGALPSPAPALRRGCPWPASGTWGHRPPQTCSLRTGCRTGMSWGPSRMLQGRGLVRRAQRRPGPLAVQGATPLHYVPRSIDGRPGHLSRPLEQ